MVFVGFVGLYRAHGVFGTATVSGERMGHGATRTVKGGVAIVVGFGKASLVVG